MVASKQTRNWTRRTWENILQNRAGDVPWRNGEGLEDERSAVVSVIEAEDSEFWLCVSSCEVLQ